MKFEDCKIGMRVFVCAKAYQNRYGDLPSHYVFNPSNIGIIIFLDDEYPEARVQYIHPTRKDRNIFYLDPYCLVLDE